MVPALHPQVVCALVASPPPPKFDLSYRPGRDAFDKVTDYWPTSLYAEHGAFARFLDMTLIGWRGRFHARRRGEQ